MAEQPSLEALASQLTAAVTEYKDGSGNAGLLARKQIIGLAHSIINEVKEPGETPFEYSVYVCHFYCFFSFLVLVTSCDTPCCPPLVVSIFTHLSLSSSPSCYRIQGRSCLFFFLPASRYLYALRVSVSLCPVLPALFASPCLLVSRALVSRIFFVALVQSAPTHDGRFEIR